MRVFAPRTDQPATRRILLAIGLGTIFGFQSWRLAEYVFAVSIPWYGQAWIWLSLVFLGFAIGATAGWTKLVETRSRFWIGLQPPFRLRGSCAGTAVGAR